MNLLLTFIAAIAGGLILFRLKIPGGMMVGAILLVTILSLSTGRAYMPGEAKVIAQCLAGAFIACSVSREDLKRLPHLWKPLLVLLTSLLFVNLLIGGLICRCSPLDLLSSMLCAVPGGDVPIIAADMGADAGKVAILQFIRMSTGIGLFPSMILLFTKNQSAADKEHMQAARISKAEAHDTACFIVTLIAAFICGIIGKKSGIPAGTLMFSMLGVIVLKLLWGKSYLPLWAKRLAQLLSGAYIGCGIAKTDVIELRYLILPALLILGGYFLNSMLTGQLLHRLFGYDLRTAMLIATPAGASDMALISSDLGIDGKEVVELQIARMVLVIALFPQIIVFIANA
jgi:hypothetical protein